MLENLPSAIFGFILGLVSGIIIQTVKYGYDRRLDKVRRLMPHIEIVHPILEALIIDIDHTSKLREKDDQAEYDRYTTRITGVFGTFRSWYTEFAEKGLKPELQSMNYDLYASIYGIYVCSQMTKDQGTNFISQNLDDVREKLHRTMNLVEEFLKE